MEKPPPILTRTIGDTLLDARGHDVSLKSVDSKVIGLYFAALDCPSCRTFTPKLMSFYEQAKKTKNFEVILISGNPDDVTFREHMKPLPWLALPHNDAKHKSRLLRRHRVASLPSLILINSRTGRVITPLAKDMLLDDPTGEKFPWKPPPVSEILKHTPLITPDGKIVNYGEIKRDYMALYFGANWCPPCKSFTLRLMDSYEKIRKQSTSFNIIFISSDRSEEAWNNNRAMMPWPSLQWSDIKRQRDLMAALQILCIPSLVLLTKDDQVLTHNGRHYVNIDPAAEHFPWHHESLQILENQHLSWLQERPCLICFTDGSSSEVQFALDVLSPVAEEYYHEYSEEEALSLGFFVTVENEISESIRECTGLEDVVPLVVILDMTESVKYLLEDGMEITASTIQNFIKRYNNEAITPISINNASTKLYYTDYDLHAEV